jgi:spore coat polysaccharide biosynthesis protein SpsF
MLKTLGIVQANFRSPRFCTNASRRLGGRSLLEWVVRRVTDSMRLNGVIVLTGQTDDAHAIGRLVPSDVPLCCCDAADEVSRVAKALETFPAEGVVRVCGDNLFIDPILIDRLVNAAEAQPDCDYVSYCSRDGRPAILSPVGLYAEWFSTDAIRRADRLTRCDGECRRVTEFFHANADKFTLRLIPTPAEVDRDDVRLTIDLEEDWEHALAIYDALGPERLDWRRIANLLDHQPAMRSRMATLNRTHREPAAV